MNLSRFSFSLSTCGLAAALVAGCGGGGGGGGNGSATPIPTSSTPTPVPTSTGPALLLRDDFSGTSLSSATWGIYSEDQTLQRTKFGFTPAIVNEDGVSFARMRLDSYNPRYVGSFKSTEIFSRQRFARGQGIEMTARLRAPNLPPGLILAFFGIFDRFNGPPSDATYSKDELDFEILTAQQEQFSPADSRNRLYINTWNNWNLSNQFDENDEGDTTRLNDDKTYAPALSPGYDYGNWNIYTIRWLPDRTEFLVNGTLERIEREVNPDEALSVHFNFWTGNPDFRQAYSESLQPARTRDANKTYSFDVDYVTVTDLAGTGARTARQFAAPPSAGLKSYRSR